jgi:hypothetical protein
VGPQTEKVSSYWMDKDSMVFFFAPGCSSYFLGILSIEEDVAQDGSWRHCFTALFYLEAKPAHVGVDVDGLGYPLHHHMAYDH